MEEYCVKMDKISRKPWGKLLGQELKLFVEDPKKYIRKPCRTIAYVLIKVKLKRDLFRLGAWLFMGWKIDK